MLINKLNLRTPIFLIFSLFLVQKHSFASNATSKFADNIENNINVSGIKIGDSVDNVKNILTNISNGTDINITESSCTTQNRSQYICEINFTGRKKVNQGQSIDNIRVYFTGNAYGNVVYAIRKNYNVGLFGGEQITIEKVMSDLYKKYGEPSFSKKIPMTFNRFVIVFNKEGNKYQINSDTDRFGNFCISQTAPSTNGIELPKQFDGVCQGKMLNAIVECAGNDTFISGLGILLIDFDLYNNAIIAENAAAKALIESETKKQASESKNNKVDF